MNVIPVIDLMNATVVHGIAGQRDRYQPIRSQLCRDSQPSSVARALVEAFGFQQVYVADLDAIAGRPPNRHAYRAIVDAGLRLILDAGLANRSRVSEIVAKTDDSLATLVVGLETLGSLQVLPELVEAIRPRQAAFSLDLCDGRPLNSVAAIREMPPAKIADRAIAAGFCCVIVLDLAGVGVGEGIRSLPLCREIRANHPEIQLVSGGGVRGVTDLHALSRSGCDAALVASALHDGRLTRKDLLTLTD